MSGSSRSPASAARSIACVVVGRDEDELALTEAGRWREALGARLSVLCVLPAPVCAVSVMGDVWCEDRIAVVDAAGDWLRSHATGPTVGERVLIPGPAGFSVGDWIARHGPLLVVAARRGGALRRALGGDAAAHVPRDLPCAVQLVSAPAAGAGAGRAGRRLRVTPGGGPPPAMTSGSASRRG